MYGGVGGTEPYPDTKRESKILFSMAAGETEKYRKLRKAKSVPEHFFQGEGSALPCGAVRAVGKASKKDPCTLPQLSGQCQGGEHPVDAIACFIGFLQKQDFPSCVRFIGGSQKRAQGGKISAREDTFCGGD